MYLILQLELIFYVSKVNFPFNYYEFNAIKQ